MVSSFFLSIIVFIYLSFVKEILIIVASSNSKFVLNSEFQERYLRLIEEMSINYPLNVKQPENYEFRRPKFTIEKHIDVIKPLTSHDYIGISAVINKLKAYKKSIRGLEQKSYEEKYVKPVKQMINLLKTKNLDKINEELNNCYSQLLFTNDLPQPLYLSKKEFKNC